MKREEAKRFWLIRYENAKDYTDPHWEASERKDHRRYVDALKAAIEALSERTGEWVWSDEDASWKCGRCDCVFEEIDWKPNYYFCPNCGADMRGEQDG